MTESHPAAEHRIDGAGARVIAVSALCMGLGASLGFIPGFAATALRNDLGISRGEVGLLVSLYFGCTGIGSVLGGRATEKFGARIVIATDMVLVAAAAFFATAIGEYWALLLAAMIGGSAYALANAGTNVAIGRAVPPQRRTLAMSIKTAGVPAMATVAAGIGAPVADRAGWQALVLAAGVLAVGATAIALVVFDDDRPAAANVRVRADLPDGFAWFAFGAFLLIAGSQPLYSWTVAYLEQSLDASAGLAGGIAAAASAGGVVFMIITANRTDRIGADARVGRLIALLGVNLAATLLVLIGAKAGIVVAAIGVMIGISAQLASIGTMHAAVVDRAPHAVARATGVTMTGYYIGALVSPAAFGWIADATDTFVWSWGATALLLLGAIPVWAIAGRVQMASGSSDTAIEIPSDNREQSENRERNPT